MLFSLTFIAIIGTAMMAGLFFTFSNFVMKALGQLSPDNGISAMQAINKTVQNPFFFLLFLGTAGISLFLVLNTFFQWLPCEPFWFLTAGLFYVAGSFLVTVLVNIPLNNRLDATDTYSEKSIRFWNVFLSRWTIWNHIRTIGSLGAAIFFTYALLTI